MEEEMITNDRGERREKGRGKMEGRFGRGCFGNGSCDRSSGLAPWHHVMDLRLASFFPFFLFILI
jgi:hypothetical protein